MTDDIRITTQMLFQGALVFALLDAILVPLLVWRIPQGAFLKLRWSLAAAAAVTWYGIWLWAVGNFWEMVYYYVFPAWMESWMPYLAGMTAAAAALGLWALALRFKGRAVPVFCLSGGLLGVLTHTWAVGRGITSKPPMLQGASPLGAVTIAFFEYMFYWSMILIFAQAIEWARAQAHRPDAITN